MSHGGHKKKHEYFGQTRSSNEHSVNIQSDIIDSFPSSPDCDSLSSRRFTDKAIATQDTFSPFYYPSYPSASLPLSPFQPVYYNNSCQGLGQMRDNYQPQFSETSSTNPEKRFSVGNTHEYKEYIEKAEGTESKYVTDTTDEEEDRVNEKQSKPTQKRSQRCSLCLNHNEIKKMKGHKYLCDYRNCACEKCVSTRKGQQSIKEMQRLRRQQLQQQQLSGNQMFDTHIRRQETSGERTAVDQRRMGLPREQEEEMIDDMKDILTKDFIKELDQMFKPNY